MVTIAVRGTASRRVPAERAAVGLWIVGEGRDRAAALEAAANAETTFADALDRLVAEGVVRDWNATDVGTGVRRHDDDGEALPEPVHEARVEVRVEFDRLAGVGAWLAGVADDVPVVVQHTEWSLSEETREAVLEELRQEAVAHGLDRARAYAAGLGLGGIEVLALSEPGLGAAPRMLSGWVAQSAGRQRKSGRPRFELRPDLIELSAEVAIDVRADPSRARD